MKNKSGIPASTMLIARAAPPNKWISHQVAKIQRTPAGQCGCIRATWMAVGNRGRTIAAMVTTTCPSDVSAPKQAAIATGDHSSSSAETTHVTNTRQSVAATEPMIKLPKAMARSANIKTCERALLSYKMRNSKRAMPIRFVIYYGFAARRQSPRSQSTMRPIDLSSSWLSFGSSWAAKAGMRSFVSG